MFDSHFAELKSAFKGDLVTPTDPDYPQAISRWAKNAARKAKLVAFVKDEEDVSLTLKYIKDTGLPFTVRGGAHSVSGASSCEGGVVIDLSRHLNCVRVDPERKLAYVGGGAQGQDVDKAAIEHGLAGVVGTANDTGVGGLILGGGYGYLSGAHGLSIDNVTQVTIVVADGTKLIANDVENSDLFWGVRGGGGNFGVVTKFVLQLHPQRRTVFAGFLIFPPPLLEPLVAWTNKWWANGLSKKEAMYQVYTRGPDKNPCIVTILFYNGSETEGREHFKTLFDLGPVADHTGEVPYEQLNAIQAQFNPPGRPSYVKGVVLTKPRVEVMKNAFDRLLQLSAGRDIDFALAYEFISPDKILEVPVHATAFFGRRPYPNVMSIARWDEDTAANLDYARDAAYELTGIIGKGNVEATEADNMGYGNYDAEGNLPEDIDGYPFSGKSPVLFGVNYPRLQTLKKKYDPGLMFSKWFVITPSP